MSIAYQQGSAVSPGDDELGALADLARNFFTREVIPNIEKFTAQGHPDKQLYRRAGELGLLCMSVPEQYGGGGGTFAHEAVLFREQALAGDSSLHLGVHSGIVPHYILAYGSESQKKRYLPRFASGEWVAAIAMTEPGTGSDLQAITTRAVPDGDGYRITGAKTFISNGLNCDVVIVAAKTDPEARGAGVSLFIVDVADEPAGFRRGQPIHKLGQKGQDTTELFFEDVAVPASALLGARNSGFPQLKTQLAQERLILGVSAVAAMERAVALTVEYTKSRQAFGAPLFALQNTRFELAECATIARVSGVFLEDCIHRHLRGELDGTTAAMAKYWLSDQQCAVIDRCLQLFGGYGYTLEYPIAQMYADARIQRIYAGANEVMKELISRSL
ncbi:MAG: acyl-CoA dehydrogenase [Mycobacterium sp.]|jgi:acyl-CoA dehydrogenase|nr:acyl-CoA dehydrogenase [Mycobacterium sp.]MDT5266498.1 acyl-CoA dehydrogenase [Mycobacterium sp.]MDT5287416.1 acyl-CoA dehydrogenase [Mycobacterium sp.]